MSRESNMISVANAPCSWGVIENVEGERGGVQAVEHGVFCELGRGDVDFPAILAALKQMDYAGWIVVEQDVLPGMGSPKASAQRNRAYLQSIGL